VHMAFRESVLESVKAEPRRLLRLMFLPAWKAVKRGAVAQRLLEAGVARASERPEKSTTGIAAVAISPLAVCGVVRVSPKGSRSCCAER